MEVKRVGRRDRINLSPGLVIRVFDRPFDDDLKLPERIWWDMGHHVFTRHNSCNAKTVVNKKKVVTFPTYL